MKWYQLFNRLDFENSGLVSSTLTVNLEQIGLRDITIYRGVGIGIVYDGRYIRLNLNQRNPFTFNGLTIFQQNNNVFLGIPDED